MKIKSLAVHGWPKADKEKWGRIKKWNSNYKSN
jgi:hypothetical protein